MLVLFLFFLMFSLLLLLLLLLLQLVLTILNAQISGFDMFEQLSAYNKRTWSYLRRR